MMKTTSHTKRRYQDEEYLEYIRRQPCALCGSIKNVVAHHVSVFGPGISTKAPDWSTAPLCNFCHQKIHSQPMFSGEQIVIYMVGWRLLGKYLEQLSQREVI